MRVTGIWKVGNPPSDLGISGEVVSLTVQTQEGVQHTLNLSEVTFLSIERPSSYFAGKDAWMSLRVGMKKGMMTTLDIVEEGKS
jgi:hypothetical protein